MLPVDNLEATRPKKGNRIGKISFVASKKLILPRNADSSALGAVDLTSTFFASSSC